MKKLLVALMAVGLAVPALAHAGDFDFVSQDTLFFGQVLTNPGNALAGRSDSCMVRSPVDGTLSYGSHKVAGLKSACVVLDVQPDSLTTHIYMAVSIRGAFNSKADSSSVIPYNFRLPANAAQLGWNAIADSAGYGLIGQTAGDSNTCASGELLWHIQPKTRAANVGLTDWNAKRLVIPLYGQTNGEAFPFPYVNVRVRVLRLYGTGKRCVVNGWITGRQ